MYECKLEVPHLSLVLYSRPHYSFILKLCDSTDNNLNIKMCVLV